MTIWKKNIPYETDVFPKQLSKPVTKITMHSSIGRAGGKKIKKKLYILIPDFTNEMAIDNSRAEEG